ncbi:alpha/beta fold hydrolase [Streptomyces sp. NPDC056835]|uniref:alpha/beta fold hydrolase n=1 Tax=Streptomyces sp. NPDC056835 TaxID=3345956 RepID=UPI0036C357BA
MPNSLQPIHVHVHDHGGEGSPLLLLHGAGRSLADWDAVAPLLTQRHRVLAVDLPGHGRSEDGPRPWSFEAAAQTIESVLDFYEIPDAVLVGHSLGGMLALYHAAHRSGGATGRTTPGAVNLDGFWWGRPDQYPGLDGATVAEGLARVGEMMRAAAGQIAPAEYVAQQAAYAEQFGIPYARAEAAARGAVRELPDGRVQTLPVRERALEMYDAMDALDLFALLRRVPCPALCVRARRPQPPMPGMEWFHELTDSYTKGLDRDLAALVEERRRDGAAPLAVEDIDATHAMLLEEPEAVAALLLAFTGGLRG